ncbi:MAG: hypothetical protein UT84_C0002G0071 [Candidatus Curtissbacteria bacterium GW2011_GWA1_40_16]|uniref:Uncharacterized protein n=1 Tax=Candidatus Curtissbacteria bacterium GW2011_GWA1_40_16 TaxID=1618405 RepID=A0A0G0TVX0_9BACT|nr:MAG: hypothetical protein UT84_C0002G0071 [Candidatus Curtissbacteria bacterium GW2011_GWA1_40_16]
MERDPKLQQFEVRRRGLLFSLSEPTLKADQLISEMIAKANELGCFPIEHFVEPSQLGLKRVEVTAAKALYLGLANGKGHALLIPSEEGGFSIVTTDRKGIYKVERERLRGGNVRTRNRLEYYQFSKRFKPVGTHLEGLDLRLKATKRLGEVMETAVELKSQREKEQGV